MAAMRALDLSKSTFLRERRKLGMVRGDEAKEA